MPNGTGFPNARREGSEYVVWMSLLRYTGEVGRSSKRIRSREMGARPQRGRGLNFL